MGHASVHALSCIKHILEAMHAVNCYTCDSLLANEQNPGPNIAGRLLSNVVLTRTRCWRSLSQTGTGTETIRTLA